MVQRKLSSLLKELHDELEQAQHIDDETRAQVREAAEELDEFLERESDEPDAFEALRERLLNLEIEHPRVAAIIGETAELISKLGV